MARHAGFGAVVSITEDLVNDIAASYVNGLAGPRFFPLPQSINLGFTMVTFAGILEMLAPKIELHPSPVNLVTVHFGFRGKIKAQAAGQPLLKWTVQLNGTVSVGLVTSVLRNQLVLGINTKTVTFEPFTVQVQQGPVLRPSVLAALQSPEMAAAITKFVNSKPPLTISPPMLTTQIDMAVPGSFKESGFSVFEWYRVRLTASRIVAKPLEHAISVGIDFDGETFGDPGQLVDLTKVRGLGSIYVVTITPHTDPDRTPILVQQREPVTAEIAATVNIGLISSVVGNQVSPQISGTPITKNVVLESLGAGYSTFEKPLRGTEEGLVFPFQVSLHPTGALIEGRFYIQPYLQTWDGPTNFIRGDNWRISVGGVEIDTPFWVDVGIFVAGVFFAVSVPILGPVIALATLSLIGDVVPALIDNIENETQRGIQSGVNAVGLPTSWSKPLPNLTKPRFDGTLRYLSFTPEGLDLGVRTCIAWSDRDQQSKGTISPQDWPALSRNSIPVSLKLSDDLEVLAGNNLMLSWQVRRTDTKQLIGQAVRSYTDPSGNGLRISHHTPELYFVDAFEVHCTATITMGSQVGEIWSGTQAIKVIDTLDRHHKYIQWGPRPVFFMNAGTGGEWWSHVRRSKIHRTAVGARCSMLRKHSARNGISEYSNALPFAWASLNDNRRPLCEYCFFGGPDKKIPFPQEDWF